MQGAAELERTLAAPARRRWRRPSAALDTALLLVMMLVLWQFASVIIGVAVLPNPVGAARRLAAIMTDGDFPGHAWETGRAFAAALVIALLSGLTMGLALGAHRLSGDVAEPILVALYSIPKITLYPVILLLFGLGISAKITFGVIHGIIPVAIFTMNAVRNMRPVYLRAARAMRLSPIQTAARMIVPAVVPEIVSGFRLGFALTLLGTLIGEMFASQRGVGYMLVKAMETNDVETVIALAMLLIAVATLASSALLALDRKLHAHAASG